MTLSNAAHLDPLVHQPSAAAIYSDAQSIQAQASAVSWGAILAGAAAAAALSLILLILGTGLGLSTVSPWVHEGVSATTIGWSTIGWLALTQILASGLGGYLAGRLRTKWIVTHTDEVYFRDTAHGFLAWAVASLVTAALLTSVIGAIVNTGVQAGASVAGGVATTATTAAVAMDGSELSKSDRRSENSNEPMGYFIDSLFRKDINSEASPSVTTSVASKAAVPQRNAEPPAPDATPMASLSETSRIFMNSIRTGALPPEDLHYVGQIVAQRTGLSQAEAEKRVSDTYARAQAKLRDAEMTARSAADKARKASAYAALWLFVSLLIGAFVASLMATFGGRRRDA